MRRTQEERDQFVAQRAHAMRHEPTKAEKALWELLEPLKFRQQVPIYVSTKNGGSYCYILDFLNPWQQLCVEADGGIHQRTRGRDRRRDTRLATIGIRTLRFANKRVLNPKEAEAIVAEVKEAMER